MRTGVGAKSRGSAGGSIKLLQISELRRLPSPGVFRSNEPRSDNRHDHSPGALSARRKRITYVHRYTMSFRIVTFFDWEFVRRISPCTRLLAMLTETSVAKGNNLHHRHKLLCVRFVGCKPQYSLEAEEAPKSGRTGNMGKLTNSRMHNSCITHTGNCVASLRRENAFELDQFAIIIVIGLFIRTLA